MTVLSQPEMPRSGRRVAKGHFPRQRTGKARVAVNHGARDSRGLENLLLSGCEPHCGQVGRRGGWEAVTSRRAGKSWTHPGEGCRGCTLRSKAGRRTQKRAQLEGQYRFEFWDFPSNSSLVVVLKCDPLLRILTLWTMGQVAPDT